MLIDWVTARLEDRQVPTDLLLSLNDQMDRVIRMNPMTGEVKWETTAWDSIRSDSHQLAVRVTRDAIWLQGSPARVIGDGDTVFGSGASSALDLAGCLSRMIAFASDMLGVSLPTVIKDWKVSRVDITNNLLLPSLDSVRDALRVLRDCEGGRYRVSQQAGDTVYWSQNSRLRKGKAYAKGPHLLYLMKKKTYNGRNYSVQEVEKANRLLRLELTLGAQFFRERLDKKWFKLNDEDLEEYWTSYFKRMIGSAEIMNSNDLRKKIFALVKPRGEVIKGTCDITEGQAKSAYATWAIIESQGWEIAKDMHSKPTWYRNLKVLRNAGLSDADLSKGQLVQLRQNIITATPVNSWAELERLAA